MRQLLGLVGTVLAAGAQVWAQAQRFDLPAPSGGVGSVAAVGDVDGDGVPDLAVGDAHGWGIVSVYSGATGSLIRSLATPFAIVQSGAATQVASVGDLDLDGYSDIIVGAPYAGISLEGGYAVFSGATSAILFSGSGPYHDWNLGRAVSGIGDINGDGRPDYAVLGGSAAIVYSGMDGTQLLYAGGPVYGGPPEINGLATVPSGGVDINHDGHTDLIVMGRQSGFPMVVHVLSGADASVLRTMTTPANGTDGFGMALAGVRDLNGDGVDDIIVGAPLETAASPGPDWYGFVQVRSGVDGSILRTIPPPRGVQAFGRAVAAAGDMDGDGLSEILVGDISGSAWVYSGRIGSMLFALHGSTGDNLGLTVASAGDVTGDGLADVIVGASLYARVYAGTSLPTNYCVPKLNSQGCEPSIGFTGIPSISGSDDFHVTATLVRNSNAGILLWSTVFEQVSFNGGRLCVGGSIVRTPAQFSGGTALPTRDCSGSFDFHISHAYAALHGLAAGTTFYAQYYYRDPPHPDGTRVGLTDGLRVTLGP